jgi:hypothetical protein
MNWYGLFPARWLSRKRQVFETSVFSGSGNYMYHLLLMSAFCAHSVFMFPMSLTINRDYFPKHLNRFVLEVER